MVGWARYANGGPVRRTLLLGLGLAIVAMACGGGPTSETEYVEDLNALVESAGSNLGAALVAYEQIDDPTSEDFVDFVERQLIVEYDVREQFEEFDPPASIDDVNQFMVDTLAQIIAAAEQLIDAADGVGSLEELEQTPEFAEYQGINTDADSMCLDVQSKINDLSEKPVDDIAWIADLRLTVQAFLDCGDNTAG